MYHIDLVSLLLRKTCDRSMLNRWTNTMRVEFNTVRQESCTPLISRMRVLAFVLCLAFIPTISCPAAVAKEIEILIRFLIPAFLVQNYTALCEANDPNFLSELEQKAKSVEIFSVHIKMEITSGLTQIEAQSVLVSAANTARQAARDELQKFSPQYPSVPAEPLQLWCRDEAKPFILRVMDKHYQEHGDFLRIIESAKR